MFGKDFINSNPTPITTNIIKENKTITYYYNSSKGDEFKFILTGPKRENYFLIAQKAFETLIKDDYLLLPDSQIYLIPSCYWPIYKKWESGKTFLTSTKTVKVFINNIQYHFVNPSYYFNIDKENPGGVYGIYYQDKLLYIGSSVSDLKARWKEHDINFRNHSSSNKMYHQNFDPNEIEYRTLITGEEISDLTNSSRVSGWLIEYTELLYIKLFQPPFNIEGISQSFSFQVKKEDIPVSYWDIFREFLMNDYCDDINKLLRNKYSIENGELVEKLS